jgi:hypothetical protein
MKRTTVMEEMVEEQRNRPGFQPVERYGRGFLPERHEIGGIFVPNGKMIFDDGLFVISSTCIERIYCISDFYCHNPSCPNHVMIDKESLKRASVQGLLEIGRHQFESGKSFCNICKAALVEFLGFVPK